MSEDEDKMETDTEEEKDQSKDDEDEDGEDDILQQPLKKQHSLASKITTTSKQKVAKEPIIEPPPPRRDTSSTDNLPWVEKYRPTDMNDVISHEGTISTIQKFIDKGELPHLLFYGPPGTGKTSTILACARRMYGQNFSNMVLELNASDDRGIDIVRNEVKGFASTQKIFSSGVKLIILDEADQMTNAAQSALRRVIEAYTKHTRFCIICNYVSKIIPALQSRCTRFRFAPLTSDQIKPRLHSIIQAEKLTVNDGAVKALITLAEGDMRKCLNILQSAAMSRNEATEAITENGVYACTGMPEPGDMKAIFEALVGSDFEKAYETVRRIKEDRGYSLVDVVRELQVWVTITKGLGEAYQKLLIQHLADLEYNLAIGGTERIQLGALVGIFQQVRLAEIERKKGSNSNNNKNIK